MGCLAAVGEVVTVGTITKHTREEVLWSDTRSPWRRSPMWLLIRVALQLTLTSHGSKPPNDLYKEYMAFFGSQMLDKALQNSVSNDLLLVMSAKITRRLKKLDDNINVSVRESILKTLLDSDKKLSERWESAQTEDAGNLDFSQLSTLDFERDTHLSLPFLDTYIEDIAKRQSERNSTAFSQWPEIIHYQGSPLPEISEHSHFEGEYATFNLQRFEDWEWSSFCDRNLSKATSVQSCVQLGEHIRMYYLKASGHYSGNPEGMKIMILTILELWVACDKAARLDCPLLDQYDPQIPTSFLQSLVLPFKGQMQRLPSAEPAEHEMHPDVFEFVSTGNVKGNSPAYMPAFESMAETSAATCLDPSQLIGKGRLLVTKDFVRTVQTDNLFVSDAFQRSVQWILTSYQDNSTVVAYMMIISPFEADLLLPSVLNSNKVALHLYRSRVNRTYPTFDHLDFLPLPRRCNATVVPQSLATQLNLFAGQLYLNKIKGYEQLCDLLGLMPCEARPGWTVAPDGSILRDALGRIGADSGLKSSPVEFLKVLMTKIRRNGEGIDKTHKGSILEGRVLGESDFGA